VGFAWRRVLSATHTRNPPMFSPSRPPLPPAVNVRVRPFRSSLLARNPRFWQCVTPLFASSLVFPLSGVSHYPVFSRGRTENLRSRKQLTLPCTFRLPRLSCDNLCPCLRRDARFVERSFFSDLPPAVFMPPTPFE